MEESKYKKTSACEKIEAILSDRNACRTFFRVMLENQFARTINAGLFSALRWKPCPQLLQKATHSRLRFFLPQTGSPYFFRRWRGLFLFEE